MEGAIPAQMTLRKQKQTEQAMKVKPESSASLWPLLQVLLLGSSFSFCPCFPQ